MSTNYTRHIQLDFIGNLRDLGGYATQTGHMVAWGKLFRSGEVKPESHEDISLLKDKAGIASILDLRGSGECSEERISLLTENGIRYESVPLLVEAVGPGYDEDMDVFNDITNLGEFYMATMINRTGFAERLISALEFIADESNHPVLFHCALGKDRTGILSAAVLEIIGVPHEIIIDDYHMTNANMPAFIEDICKTQQGKEFYEAFPSYMWLAQKESMKFVLSEIGDNYGSFKDYLVRHGCDPSLFTRLADVLLDGTD